MSPRIPLPVTLRGRFVELEPLHEGHLGPLTAALHHPEVFAGGWGGGAAAYDPRPDGFADFLRGYLGAERPFAVRIVAGPDAGTVVGTTSLGEWEPAHERTHLGWTAYDPRVWGTGVNAECKLLLLAHVFEHGWGRVRIQADALNARSIAAIARIGASREGVTRRDKRRADGTWRDAVVFSVIADDWPDVRDRLRARVDATRPPRLGRSASTTHEESR
ncbi:MAG: GNAT family protein [Propionibacterium sp.]|nr:GNAT family protein [Propionibacterium sp.]